jgi:hypothetical protein
VRKGKASPGLSRQVGGRGQDVLPVATAHTEEEGLQGFEEEEEEEEADLE